MRLIQRLSLLFGTLCLQACSIGSDTLTEGTRLEAPTDFPTLDLPAAATPQPDTPGLSLAQLRNSDYQLGLLDQVRTVSLVDGKYQEGIPGLEDFLSVSMTEFFALGDLDSDGKNEAVTIVTETHGGVGFFTFLVVYQNINEEPVFWASVFLDERPGINTLSIDYGEVFVDAVVHGSDDSLCCPSLPSTRHYSLKDTNLVMTDFSTRTPSGELREINIESPANGASVSGIINIVGNISISPFENTLVYRIYDLGGVELSAGPINVEAADLGSPGTFDKAIDLGNILTDTTIRILVQDVNVADGSLFAMDSVILRIR